MDRFIKFEQQGGVAVITFSRPEILNAWHSEMRGEIGARLAACNEDRAVRAVIMTGAGERAFCAGQDLWETKAITGGEGGVAWLEGWLTFYGAIRALDKPLIGALNGVAAGSAFQVAMMCDLRVGHPEVKMGQPEINSGIASTLGPWLMLERIGWSRTVELTLTGRMMDADECHRIGLINHLVPRGEVMRKAREVAEELAAKPPIAMKLDKRRFRELSEPAFQEAIEAGRRIQKEAYASGEPQASMEKFFAEREKRKRGG
jgi:enoyl-CoA hydratase/carnithine racemase